MNTKIKDKIKMSLAIAVLSMIIGIVFIIVLLYQIEGEKNMPYVLSKISIISTAEAVSDKENPDTSLEWKRKINQINDIYISIDENGEYAKNKIIDSVTIKNIQVAQEPKKGTIKAFMPSGIDKEIFSNDEEYIIEDKLEYIGGKASNTKTLEIGNKGGLAVFRISNTDIVEFVSNTEEEIVQDGKLIEKMQIPLEDINFKISFDIVIKIEKINYKANVKLNLPYGNICEEGKTGYEITDMKDIIFKRENNNILNQIS